MNDQRNIFGAGGHAPGVDPAVAATGLRLRNLVTAAVELGDNLLLISGAILGHGWRIGYRRRIRIGTTVCGEVAIGAGAQTSVKILRRFFLGSGAVIAARAVVTEDVEPLTLAAGGATRPLRRIHEQELA